jgi:hypothetical protein
MHYDQTFCTGCQMYPEKCQCAKTQAHEHYKGIYKQVPEITDAEIQQHADILKFKRSFQNVNTHTQEPFRFREVADSPKDGIPYIEYGAFRKMLTQSPPFEQINTQSKGLKNLEESIKRGEHNHIKPDIYNVTIKGVRINVFDIAEAYGLSTRLAFALKYILRAGKKPDEPKEKDLKKAIETITQEINK